jgi:hypothetical protein
MTTPPPATPAQPQEDTNKAIDIFKADNDSNNLVVLYNQQLKDVDKLMEALKASKPEDRASIQQQLEAVSAAQSALTEFMTKNKIKVPVGGFGMCSLPYLKCSSSVLSFFSTSFRAPNFFMQRIRFALCKDGKKFSTPCK